MIAHTVTNHAFGLDQQLCPAFSFDQTRLDELRDDFDLCIRQKLLGEAVDMFLRRTWGRGLLQQPEIADVIANVQLMPKFSDPTSPPPLLDVARETIAGIQGLYAGNGNGALPNDMVMELQLQQLCEGATECKEVRDQLGCQLRDLVAHELASVAGHTALEMHVRYAPTWRDRTWGISADLGSVARRTAHVAVLHWLVWGPVLYLQPLDRFQS